MMIFSYLMRSFIFIWAVDSKAFPSCWSPPLNNIISAALACVLSASKASIKGW
jgi:hypothetical protein